MKSLTERLRDGKYIMFFDGWTSSILAIEAADRIDELEAKLAKARSAALEEAAKAVTSLKGNTGVYVDRREASAAIRSLREEE